MCVPIRFCGGSCVYSLCFSYGVVAATDLTASNALLLSAELQHVWKTQSQR